MPVKRCLLILLISLGLVYQTHAEKAEYPTINWIELMPEEDLLALLSPPEDIMQIEEGGPGDFKPGNGLDKLLETTDEAYQSALTSTKTVPELNGKKISIPGFVVPVEIEADKTTGFFIVPYFGACIHFPPPPPNQTIYARYPKGINLSETYDAFIFRGTLQVSQTKNDLATSSYELTIAEISEYVEPE